MLLTLALATVLSGFGVQAVRPVVAVRQAAAHHAQKADSLDVTLYARILKSADQRTLDTALLATALESHDAEIRRAGARTLSQVALRHRHRAVPLLRNLTHDADSVVASTAIFGLGLVRDTNSLTMLASIVRASGAAAPAAAWSLGEVGAPASDTIAALLGELPARGAASRILSRAISRELLIAMSKMRPLNFTAVAPYLRSRDSELRWAAAYAVARARAKPGLRALLDAR